MIKLILMILEGIYNHLEFFYLDIRWYLFSLLKHKKHIQPLDFPRRIDWVVVMPSKMLISFHTITSAIIFKYKIENGKVVYYKGWKDQLGPIHRYDWFRYNDVDGFVIEVHNQIAYDEIDKLIS